MPLPQNGAAWPPADLAPIHRIFREHEAWWVGTVEGLRAVYAKRDQKAPRTTREREGGLVGTVAAIIDRFFWGRYVQDDNSGSSRDQTHVPIAADLARASADLLYAEPPRITCEHQATQARLEDYAPDLHQVLASGAEVGAAFGGRFHRVTWDKTVADAPFLTTVDADAALPEFRHGRLVAVTFWYVVERKNQQVLRHLERHELDSTGLGLIIHGLYDGTAESLGHVIPLTDHASTAHLADKVDEYGVIRDGRTPGLCVVYVPNQGPQKRWRGHIIGQHLGRSDFDGVESLMDNADETMSSLMRDIRLAKARLIVPEEYLEVREAGKGASFDLDRDVVTPVNVPVDGEMSTKDSIVAQQFDIRVEEHLAALTRTLIQVVFSAGYSPSTFGLTTDTAAMTATEVQARERRTFLTRDRKIRNERPAVIALLRKMLAIDAAIFGTKGLDLSASIDVEFGDGVQESPLALAQTAAALYAASSASTAERVRMLHPEWDDERVQQEATDILTESGLAPDPFAITS